MCLSFLNNKPTKKPPPPPPLRIPSRNHHLFPPTPRTPTPSTSTTASTASSSFTSTLTRRSLSTLTSSPVIYSPTLLLSSISHLRPFHRSSSSTSFHTHLSSHPVLIVLRRLRRHPPPNLRRLLPLLSRSHHLSLVSLLGASLTDDNHRVLLVYEFVHGASLKDCLRNVNNPGFTVLGTWISRVRIAADVAHGVDYAHNCSVEGLGFVHNRIKSSSIVVTEPDLGAKLCHFGTAQLCGEVVDEGEEKKTMKSTSRTKSGRFEGTRGYMSPEFKVSGVPTLKSDVFAFGVVLLELVSGEQPLGTWVDEDSGVIRTVSLIDTAREVVRAGGGGGGSNGMGRLRKWVDRRLRDSYPVDVAERLVKLAVDCCDDDPDRRPGMNVVAGMISKMYLESKTWAEGFGGRNDITVSLAPR